MKIKQTIIVACVMLMTCVAAPPNDVVGQTLDKKVAELDKRYVKLKTSYIEQAIEAYEQLKADAMKRGSLEEALLNKTRADALRRRMDALKEPEKPTEKPPAPIVVEVAKPVDPLEKFEEIEITKVSDWILPSGGQMLEARGEFALRGRGNGPANEAVAVFAKDLKMDYTVSGEILVEGKFGGFAFQYDKDTGRHYTMHSTDGGATEWQYHADSFTRRAYARKKDAIWVRNKWMQFTLSRKDNRIKLTLDGQTVEMGVVRASTPGRWGLVQYDDIVRARRIKVVNGKYDAK